MYNKLMIYKNLLKTVTICSIAILFSFEPVFSDSYWTGCSSDTTTSSNYNSYLSYGTQAQIVYQSQVLGGSQNTITIGNLQSGCSEVSNPPDSCPFSQNQAGGEIGGVGISSPVIISAPATGNVSFIRNTVNGTDYSTSIQFTGTESASFSAPSQAGQYQISAYSWSFHGTDGCEDSISYTVTAPASTECSDNQPNDSDGLNDEADPQCHTDCNVNNAGSYVATHNSETTPPNGTCPTPPTLELNARAAFFQVVKNFIAFITTKAFAVTK